MSAPADQIPSSFDARTQMSTSSSNRTASIVRLRSFMRSASYVLAFGLFIHATATRSFFSSEMYVRSIAFASLRCNESGHNKRWPLPARSRLRRAPLLVEQELLFDELPVPARHVPIGQDRPKVVDVDAEFDRLPAVRQQFPEDLIDVDSLRLRVLQRLEDALDEVPAEFRAEHLQAARIPHVQGVLEVLDPEVPAVRDRRHRDRLHEGLSRREVVRFLQEPHP